VTAAAIENVDQHIVSAGLAALNGKRRQQRFWTSAVITKPTRDQRSAGEAPKHEQEPNAGLDKQGERKSLTLRGGNSVSAKLLTIASANLSGSVFSSHCA
jgi:hypothetical protein